MKKATPTMTHITFRKAQSKKNQKTKPYPNKDVGFNVKFNFWLIDQGLERLTK